MKNSKDLRVVFMGTPGFAKGVLMGLVDNGFNVVGVVTATDKHAGRGRKLQGSDVGRYSEDVGLKTLKPSNLKSQDFIDELKSLNADVFVVVAFRMLPEIVWSMVPTINLHASLLPQYRGAAPINWAIINGERKTGVTTFFIEKEIDTGKILLSKDVEISDKDTAGTLHDKLMGVGTELVLDTLVQISSGNMKGEIQNVSGLILKSAPKIFKNDCKVNWSKSSQEIYNFIRGLSPYPAAWTVVKNNKGDEIVFKIFKTTIGQEDIQIEVGTIETDNKNYLRVGTLYGYLSIDELQMPGKKRLPIKQFLAGYSF
ncbi:MAG: methionyl-tRNA formyltransferase [Bacteroidales bacterium]